LATSRVAEPAVHQETVLCPATAARDDAVALFRLADLDAELGRLRQSMATILEPLEQQRSDLAALAELIQRDRPQGLAHESGETLEARRRRLLRNRQLHADFARALKRDEGDVLVMSRQLQAHTAGLAGERDAVLARVSPPLSERYEAAIRKGQYPALAAVRDGRCPGCGNALPDASWQLAHESLRVVPCSGCLRLLYDPSWTARALMPPALRPVTTAKP
jgi:hypothetical protein